MAGAGQQVSATYRSLSFTYLLKQISIAKPESGVLCRLALY